MEIFLKWLSGIAGVITLFLFWKSWKENMESIKLLCNNLTPWQFMFFLVLLAACLSLWGWRVKVRENKEKNDLSKKASISLNRPIEIIRRPEGQQYLVEGDTCYYIPDPPTFEYLRVYFGFSWDDSNLMLFDDIKKKYIIGKQLPSVLSYCPKQNN